MSIGHYFVLHIKRMSSFHWPNSGDMKYNNMMMVCRVWWIIAYIIFKSTLKTTVQGVCVGGPLMWKERHNRKNYNFAVTVCPVSVASESVIQLVCH